jgi:uncharacterized protein (TIGR00730 family)
MNAAEDLTQSRLADAAAELQDYLDQIKAVEPKALSPNARRLAFADSEFLLRRETRGIRIQLEMLKPDLGQAAQGIENTIVVFGSARFRSPETAHESLQKAQQSGDAEALGAAQRDLRGAHYYEQARQFAGLVARHSERQPDSEKLFIATGGGPGIMEAANRGAHEQGALNVGLNIALPHEQQPNPYITPSLSFKFHYFAARKMHFMMRAKALLAFPGGFGTFDELFEVITLVQTRKVKPVPIILFGSDYWKRVFNTDLMIEEGVISVTDLELFSYVDEPLAAWAAIQGFYGL